MEGKYNKYKNHPVLNNKNTFVQFDQEEAVRSAAASARLVFDFSRSGQKFDDLLYNYANPTFSTAVFAYNRPTSTVAVSTVTENFTGSGGFAGQYEQMRNLFGEDVLAKDNTSQVPTVQQKMCMFLNAAAFYAWGSVDTADFEETFRAGHVELTFKTDKENCVIASGSTQVSLYKTVVPGQRTLAPVSDSLQIRDLFVRYPNSPIKSDVGFSSLNDDQFYTEQFDKSYFTMNVELKDGKLFLNYRDYYNPKEIVLQLEGNTYVADNEWHHVVINFGRPGQIKYPGTKFNKKFIEFWVDSKLDKRFNNHIIQSEHIQYPYLDSLFMSLRDALYDYIVDIDGEDIYRGPRRDLGITTNEIVWNNDIVNWQDRIGRMIEAYPYNFTGALHTLVFGTKHSLNPKEIQKRYSLWSNTRVIKGKEFVATAELKDPAVVTNKKKALKLFWNNILDKGQNGLSLDNNYQVDTYCVSYKTLNSPTELFNQDIASKKQLNKLNNVKVALTDNVITWAPAGVQYKNHWSAGFLGLNVPFANIGAPYKDFSWRDASSISSLSSGPQINNSDLTIGELSDQSFSNIKLFEGDRILLTNQFIESLNGIWIYNGPKIPLSKDPEDTIDKINNGLVYVEDGIYAGKWWAQSNVVGSINDWQKWTVYDNDPELYLDSNPIYLQRWTDSQGIEGFIDLENDVDISKYDLIVFMNYPETRTEIFEALSEDTELVAEKQYNKFISKLKSVVENGASLFVSSPMLASDLKIISKATSVEQEIEEGDQHSADINPFQINESKERYFDTHRQNVYHLNLEVPGLTDKQTYTMTDFISYTPESEYEFEEYHAKYSYRPTGLKEGDEFFIPSMPLREIQTRTDLPGKRSNAKLGNLMLVKPSDVLAGTILTGTANNHYHQSVLTANEYDDYATSIIVQSGDLLDGVIVNGKIFVNFVEDTFTMSQEIYNFATIQNFPSDDPNETANTKLWQYSTNRLNRKPKTVNIKELTKHGQTVPTDAGGGPMIQAPTNSSIGEIRNTEEQNDATYSSGLYFLEEDEKYDLIKIPTYSLTWLGLKWLES